MLISGCAEGLHRAGEGWKNLEQTLVLGDADGLKLPRDTAASFPTLLAPDSIQEIIRKCKASLEWGRRFPWCGFFAQRPLNDGEHFLVHAAMVSGRSFFQLPMQLRRQTFDCKSWHLSASMVPVSD